PYEFFGIRPLDDWSSSDAFKFVAGRPKTTGRVTVRAHLRKTREGLHGGIRVLSPKFMSTELYRMAPPQSSEHANTRQRECLASENGGRLRTTVVFLMFISLVEMLL